MKKARRDTATTMPSAPAAGKVYSLESDLLDSLEEEVMEKLGFLVTNHEVKLYGLCSECRKKNEKKEVMNREEREK